MTDFAFPTLSIAAPPSVEWGVIGNTKQGLVSPLNGSVQTVGQPGSRFACSFMFEDLSIADAALLKAFVMKLNGREHRALLWPFERPVPEGTIALSGVTVSGAVVQGATTVTLANCGAGSTLAVGDYFAVAGQLVMAVAAATANGSGVMAGVEFRPFVRDVAGWANGAAVTTNKPTARFMLAGDESRWTTRAPVITALPFDFVEAFA